MKNMKCLVNTYIPWRFV